MADFFLGSQLALLHDVLQNQALTVQLFHHRLDLSIGFGGSFGIRAHHRSNLDVLNHHLKQQSQHLEQGLGHHLEKSHHSRHADKMSAGTSVLRYWVDHFDCSKHWRW